MPAVKLDPQHVAFARRLVAEGWTHGRVANLFGVNRATVSYALSSRKTLLPDLVDVAGAELLAQAVVRAQRAAAHAIAAELKKFAAEIETNPTP